MTRITHTQIEVTKNPLLKVPIVVPQWEAHVVLALWGDDANVTGTIVIDRVIPEANDEFTRLANKYGPRDEDIPFVARVYGGFGPGLRALENEFRVSIAGSNLQSQAAQVSEVAIEVAAPEILTGFEGSVAPKEPELTIEDEKFQVPVSDEEAAKIDAAAGVELGSTELTDEQIDTIDKVPTLAGNTIKGRSMESFMNDVSDLTGEDEESTDEAA